MISAVHHLAQYTAYSSPYLLYDCDGQVSRPETDPKDDGHVIEI